MTDTQIDSLLDTLDSIARTVDPDAFGLPICDDPEYLDDPDCPLPKMRNAVRAWLGGGWTRVKDDLPDLDRAVLIAENGSVDVAQRARVSGTSDSGLPSGEIGWFYDEGRAFPTHWRELPEPPCDAREEIDRP